MTLLTHLAHDMEMLEYVQASAGTVTVNDHTWGTTIAVLFSLAVSRF